MNMLKSRASVFADKETVELADYRPCAVCMRQEYLEWKDKW